MRNGTGTGTHDNRQQLPVLIGGWELGEMGAPASAILSTGLVRQK